MALTQVNLANIVTGVLPAANGGTGQATALIPSGTVMMFGQTAAPTGFTKLTTNDNAALRVVSGTASTGGSVNFTTAFASQTPAGSVSTSISAISGTVGTSGSTTATGTVGATTLSTSQIPSHTHSVVGHTAGGGIFTINNNYGTSYNDNTGTEQTLSTGGGGSHDHTFTGTSHTHTGGSFTFGSGTASSSFTGTAINLAVKYVDVIMATKD